MKNILIITYWSFNDALIQTYTLPYVKIIRDTLPNNKKIFLVTMEQKEKKMSSSEWNKQKQLFLEQNIYLLRFSYNHFGVLMILKFFHTFLYLYGIALMKGVSHIHTWCTPAGGIGYILSILSGKKLVIDSYEPHAEPMLESGTWNKESLKFKLLFWLEKKQAQRAKHIITCVNSMKDYVKKKYKFSLKKSYTKPACVDFNLFNQNIINTDQLVKQYQLKDRIVGIYAGKFGGSYLENEVFDFVKIAENYWGKDKFKFILLTSHDDEYVQELMTKAGVDNSTIIKLFVPHKEVPKYFALAHFGITPFKPVPSKRYGSPIKNGEYWAMGLPVVITKNISDDSDIIEKENGGYVLKEMNSKEYTNACNRISNLLKNENQKNKIRELAIKYRNFDIARDIYKEIYS